MDLNQILVEALSQDASDIHIKVGTSPIFRVNGELKTWDETKLGKDLGKYAWIQWTYPWQPKKSGKYKLMVRATSSMGQSQPFEPLWNPAGFMRNNIEKIDVTVK